MGQYIDVKSRGARGAKKCYMAPLHTNFTQVPSEATSTNSVLYTHSLRTHIIICHYRFRWESAWNAAWLYVRHQHNMSVDTCINIPMNVKIRINHWNDSTVTLLGATNAFHLSRPGFQAKLLCNAQSCDRYMWVTWLIITVFIFFQFFNVFFKGEQLSQKIIIILHKIKFLKKRHGMVNTHIRHSITSECSCNEPEEAKGQTRCSLLKSQ